VLTLLPLGILAATSLFLPPVPLPAAMLRPAWSALGVCLLLVALSRLYLQAPAGGHSVTLALALLAVGAAGGTVTGPGYPLLVAAFLAAAALARRRSDPTNAPWSAFSRRWGAAALLAVGCAVACTAAATVVLPEAHGWMLAKIMHAAKNRTGFSTRLWLGSLHELALSDEVVMRVRGPAVDYLRGAVLSRYEAGARTQPGRWSPRADDATTVRPMPRSPEPGGPATQVELCEEEPERYFLPLDAVDVAVPTGLARIDREGVASPVAAEPADHYWFRVGRGSGPVPVEPDAEDRQVPAALEPTLRALGGRWTASARDEAAKLEAIERRLQTEYRYSLDFDRSSAGDPVMEFLLENRSGHCEYFAAAMVLLSRAVGIPARLVAGYRVTERSELGGYYLVRQRNAHTWVEAWVPGQGWSRFDPTPPAELAQTMPSVTPLGSAFADLVRSWGAAGLRWLDQRTPLEIVSLLLLLVAVALVVRLLRHLRRRWIVPPLAVEAAPLPCFEALTAALARVGIVRSADEPLEALARRARASGLPRRVPAEAAELVLRYAALRYGGRGEATGLAADVARFVEDLPSG
jgi:transglutaminase-like putative cysteine protease